MQIKLTPKHPLYGSFKNVELFIWEQESNGDAILETLDGAQIFAEFSWYDIQGAEVSEMDFKNMLNKPLESVKLSKSKDEIIFTFQDGSSHTFGVEGDCCSYSWIEHLTVPKHIRGAIILSVVGVEDATPWDGHVCPEEEVNYRRACGHDSLVVYNTLFRTNKGDIVLEYRNDSNGYYGGYLVDLPA